jgi:hypothetical protein
MAQYMSNSGKLASEQVVVSAPLSFAGSAQRIWKITDHDAPAMKYGMMILAVVLISFAWTIVFAWYCTFGLLVVPYRLIRRGNRKDKVRALQHREQLEQLTAMQQQQSLQTTNLIQQNQNKRD